MFIINSKQTVKKYNRVSPSTKLMFQPCIPRSIPDSNTTNLHVTTFMYFAYVFSYFSYFFFFFIFLVSLLTRYVHTITDIRLMMDHKSRFSKQSMTFNDNYKIMVNHMVYIDIHTHARARNFYICISIFIYCSR